MVLGLQFQVKDFSMYFEQGLATLSLLFCFIASRISCAELYKGTQLLDTAPETKEYT